MDATNVMTIITAFLGSGVVVAVVNYLQERRKKLSEARVAEANEKDQIELFSIQGLEAKLGYLSKVINILEAHNIRIGDELEDQYKMNSQLNNRVRELMHRCDQLEDAVKRLCLENGLDVRRYLD